jgi:polyferredoxin
MKSQMRLRVYCVLVLVLLLAGIPWYRNADTQDPLIGGIPLWAWVTIATAVAIAALTAWAALRMWPDSDGDDTDV